MVLAAKVLLGLRLSHNLLCDCRAPERLHDSGHLDRTLSMDSLYAPISTSLDVHSLSVVDTAA